MVIGFRFRVGVQRVRTELRPDQGQILQPDAVHVCVLADNVDLRHHRRVCDVSLLDNDSVHNVPTRHLTRTQRQDVFPIRSHTNTELALVFPPLAITIINVDTQSVILFLIL